MISEPFPPVPSAGALFSIFEEMCEGAITVDQNAKIVWLSERYCSLLGLEKNDAVIGRDIESLIPNSLLRQVVLTGKPIPIDIMCFGDRNLVVSRLPLYDSQGKIAGAVGFVLLDGLDYLKPLISKFEKMQVRLTNAEAQLAKARGTRYSIASIVGNSPEMVEIRRQARRMAHHHSPVLLLGETGTGKELLAQAIHGVSNRAVKDFVAVNMAAIPEALLEAEFFGVAPGAFTGAARQARKGKLEIADGGTLFLDEIGDLPIQMQAKLLRVLEEQSFEAVGSNDVKKVDIRIIAATSRDLESKIESGEFRKDLFYRLNVLQIKIPPLRERLNDLRLLAEVLLEQISQRSGMPVKELERSGLLYLSHYHWPGNVRELKNILERSCLQSDSESIDTQILALVLPNIGVDNDVQSILENDSMLNLPQLIANVEKETILNALKTANGKKAKAARLLGIARSTLYEKLNEYKLSD